MFGTESGQGRNIKKQKNYRQQNLWQKHLWQKNEVGADVWQYALLPAVLDVGSASTIDFLFAKPGGAGAQFLHAHVKSPFSRTCTAGTNCSAGWYVWPWKSQPPIHVCGWYVRGI